MVKKKAIFFDRDGTLIKAPTSKEKKPKSIKTIKEIEILDSVEQVCDLFRKNFYLIMITNQPDVGRNINTKKNVKEINSFLKKKLKLDKVYVNYSHQDSCPDRKPNPGMILRAQKHFNIDLLQSYVVGDRWRDIGAGLNSGCQTIFIDNNYNEKNIFRPNYTIKQFKEILEIIK